MYTRALSNKPIMATFVNASTTNIVNSMEFGKMKIGGAGNKSIPVNMKGKGNKPFMIQLPLMMTWGIERKEYDGNAKMTMSMQFPNGKYSTEAHDTALANLKEFEQFIMQSAVTNSKEWLNKSKASLEVVDALFNRMLKHPNDKETKEPDFTKAPTLSVKIPNWDGRIDVDVFNQEGEVIFPNGSVQIDELVTKKMNVQVLLQCGGIYFVGTSNFGVTWRAKQIIVHEPRGIPRGVCVMERESGAAEVDGLSKPAPKVSARSSDDGEGMTKSFAAAEESSSASLEVLSDEETGDMPGDPTGAGGEPPVKGRKRVIKK